MPRLVLQLSGDKSTATDDQGEWEAAIQAAEGGGEGSASKDGEGTARGTAQGEGRDMGHQAKRRGTRCRRKEGGKGSYRD